MRVTAELDARIAHENHARVFGARTGELRLVIARHPEEVGSVWKLC